MARERHEEQAYKRKIANTEENSRPLHATEVSAGVASIFGEYVEREKMKEYLVDGAILKCSKSTLLPFQMKNTTGIMLKDVHKESEEERENRERTRLYVRKEDGTMEVEKSFYATTLDCKKGELCNQSIEEDKEEGPNMYPFRCNCKEGCDRAEEEELIKEHIDECKENGVCQYLMDLNDTWVNWPSEQRRFYEKRLVKVPIETEDGMKEFSVDAECVSMTSMLFCKHGGLITPVISGQVAFENGLVTRTTLKSVGFLEISDESIQQLNVMLYLYDITSIEEIRHFISHSVVESWQGKHLEEQKGEEHTESDYEYFVNKYYNNKKIRDILGNESERDAYVFRGGGYLQLTGRYNYQGFSDYLEDHGRKDERIMQEGAPIIAQYYAWESATWYWKHHEEKKAENVLWNGTEWVENDGTVKGTTKFINGGDSQLKEREIAYAAFQWED